MALFERGHKPLPGSGRAKGVKNRLSHAFLTALVEDFEQHGDNTLTDIDDTQLVEFIEYIRLQLGERTQRIASRADTETDGGPAQILLPVSKAT